MRIGRRFVESEESREDGIERHGSWVYEGRTRPSNVFGMWYSFCKVRMLVGEHAYQCSSGYAQRVPKMKKREGYDAY